MVFDMLLPPDEDGYADQPIDADDATEDSLSDTWWLTGVDEDF